MVICFQQLSEELSQQEKLLAEMGSQVDVYRNAGKLEAAARLEEQRSMLQVRKSKGFETNCFG